MNLDNPYRPPSSDVQFNPATGVDETSPLSTAGRFTRLSYLGWTMLLSIASGFLQIPIMLLTAAGSMGQAASGATGIVNTILSLALLGAVLYFAFIFAIRRCHDFNASGWWSLLLLVPLANLALYFIPGTQGDNRFGSPRSTRTWEKVLGLIFVVLFVVGILAAIAIPSYFDYMERAQEAEARLGALIPFLSLS